MIMTTRVRKPPIRLEELSDELLSPHQITGSVPFSDTAFSLYYWAALFWHPICLCPEDPKVNRLTTQYHFISRPFEIFFWRSLIGQWEAVFPNHIKNDSQWQSSQLEPFFRPWMNKWNWLHFGWPVCSTTVWTVNFGPCSMLLTLQLHCTEEYKSYNNQTIHRGRKNVNFFLQMCYYNFFYFMFF